MIAGPVASPSSGHPGWQRWLPSGLAVATFAGHAMVASGGDADPSFAALSGLADPVTPVIARAVAMVPVGSPGYRLALASALGAALAVLLIARLVIAAGKDDAATVAGAAAGGLIAAVGVPLVAAGTQPGSGSWLAAAIAGVLVLGHQVALGAGAASGLGAVLVLGLAIAIESTAAALLVPVAILLALRLQRGARWPLAAPAMLTLALTAALAQPLLRAATGRTAAVDDGAPATVTALVAQRTPSWSPPPPDDVLWSWLEAGGDALGPLGIAVAVVGALALFAPRSRWLAASVLITVAVGAAAELLAHRPSGAALVAVGTSALVGAGVSRIARAVPLASGQAAVGGALALLVAATAAMATAQRVDGDGDGAGYPAGDGNSPRGP